MTSRRAVMNVILAFMQKLHLITGSMKLTLLMLNLEEIIRGENRDEKEI